MKKLKVAILWHQHQPYYLYKDEYILPWVRLHGVKDYYDLPALLNEYPSVKQTINLAPSLILQIEDYVKGKHSDKIQRLTRIPAKYLSEDDKIEILNTFFIIQYSNLLQPNYRYNELFEFAKDKSVALKKFETRDWLDLQVWYNLAWIGQISRRIPFIQRLFRKQLNFTEEEKLALLDYHTEILNKITPEMNALRSLGQIEVSISPYHHPILPLLCNSESALEAMPHTPLPSPIYKYPQDAEAQIARGIAVYERLFKTKPSGMWPSEGSVSNEALSLIAKHKIKWIATDENILAASLKNNYLPTYKYFPFEVATPNGDITLFFRDHTLSDKIGFIYSNWNNYDAACDFRECLLSIRRDIINNHTEDALDSAVVPIILDGENCWEFYHENGYYFLKDFFNMFEYTDQLETVLFSECLNLPIPSFLPKLENVRAGSWINGNFSIWIGHNDDVKAWNMLSKVRALLEENKAKLSKEQYEEIINEIYIAEGSDWFWWYGPEHDAPNKPDFDVIFRWRITKIYQMLGLEPPAELDCPITLQPDSVFSNIIPPKDSISPKITGLLSNFEGWQNAGTVLLNSQNSAMHQIDEIISNMIFGYDNNFIYFRIKVAEFINNKYEIELHCVNDANQNLRISFSDGCFTANFDESVMMQMAAKDCIDIAIEANYFNKNVKFSITTLSNEQHIHYPTSGFFIHTY